MFKQQNNQKIYELFRAITKDLNLAGVRPIVYGSLGLYLSIGELGSIADIDLLIADPNGFEVCRDIAVRHGFIIDPEHDRELEGHDTYISFLELHKVEELVGTQIKLERVASDGIDYYNLSPETYLAIYNSGLENKFRREKKEIDDLVKIEQIEKYLLSAVS